MIEINQPLTNAQLEILKAFSYDLDEHELQELKGVLAKYFAKRAINSADKAWHDKGWTDEKVEEILNTKLRKSGK